LELAGFLIVDSRHGSIDRVNYVFMVTSVTPSIEQYMPPAQARAEYRSAYVTLDPVAYLSSTTLVTQLAKQTHASPNVAITNGTDSYHRNQQYSVTAITTSTGSIAERYAYSAYGQPTVLDASASVLSSSAINNRYTYTGREWDATLGLHHFRARWMNPSAGRFLGRDPIGYLGGASLLNFLKCQPTRFVDPTGLLTIQDNYIPPVTNEFPSNYPQNYGWPKGSGGPVWFDFPAYKAKRCIFRKKPFLNQANGGIDIVPVNEGVNIPYSSDEDMLKKISENRCCEVIFAGHQGGANNNGGVEGIIPCPDSGQIGKKIRAAMIEGGCSNCSLILAACGGGGNDKDARDNCREVLATSSGCAVYGTRITVPFYDHSEKNPAGVIACTFNPNDIKGGICPGGGKYVNFPFYPYPSNDPLTPKK
jgi:RHS repeat-associated protein